VASQDSAGLNGTVAIVITSADHSSICKFEGKAGSYLMVIDRLQILRIELLERSRGISSNPESGNGRTRQIGNVSQTVSRFGSGNAMGNSRVYQGNFNGNINF
jgi:hypothetical protein